MAEVQSKGGITIYLECESALEASRAASLGLYTDAYVQKLGLDVEPLIILSPTHILEAFEMIEFNIKEARVDNPDGLICIVWDSVAATPTTAEAKEENEDYASIAPGLAARQVSYGFRRLTSILNKYQVALICLNFIKEKINSGFGGFGDNTATIAQKPLGQHASVRIQLVNTGSVGTKKSESSGVKVLAKINKNKIAPPHREANFSIIYATGTDNEGSMLDMAKSLGIVAGKGVSLSFGDEKFTARKWPDVACHDAVVAALKAKVEKNTTALLGNWVPDEDDDEDDFDSGKEKFTPEDDEDDE
jgi:recombination protein RecA